MNLCVTEVQELWDSFSYIKLMVFRILLHRYMIILLINSKIFFIYRASDIASIN